jgi:hypothetical protein
MQTSERTPAGWAKHFGLERAPRRWRDDVIERELRLYLRGKQVWPKAADFQRDAPGSLYAAILKTGGPAAWAARVGIPHTPRPRWTDETIEAELRPLVAGRADWPTHNEFTEAGQRNLYKVIAARPGGHDEYARRHGLPRSSRRSSPVQH